MMYIAGILFLFIFAAINIFIGIKGWNLFKVLIPFLNIYVYWGIFILIVLSFFIGRMGRRQLPMAIDYCFNLIGSYWLAALFFLIIALAFFGIIRIFIRVTGVGIYYRSGNWNMSLILGLATVIVISLLLIYGTYNADHTKIVKYDVNINKRAGDLKELNIVMVSDIHLGSIVGKNRLNDMIASINNIKPDIVIFAGDIIDDDITPFKIEHMGESFKDIKSKYGVYAVLGNHEYIGGNIEETEAAYKDAGIKLLKDKAELVNNSFYVIGRDDVSGARFSNKKRADVSQLISGCDKSLPMITVDHQPIKLEEPQKAGIDLQFSGHTHKGQFFPNNLITKKIFEVDWGYLKKDNLNVIVSSGYGTWGPPIRIGTNSEIVNTHVKFE